MDKNVIVKNNIDFENELVETFLDSEYTLPEMAKLLLEKALLVTGSEKGVVFKIDHENEVELASIGAENWDSGFFLEIRDSAKKNNDSNSFYANSVSPIEIDFRGRLVILQPDSVMVASASSKNRNICELILISSSKNYSEDKLSLVSKMASIFSMAIKIKDSERTIQQAKREAEDAVAAKSQFLANVSHEIRAPLNGITCMGSLLQDIAEDQDQRELIDIILYSAGNITKIIQDLMDITQITAGRFSIRKESVDLEELARNIIENFRSDAKVKNITLDFKVDSELKNFVGDNVRLGQILTNLVSNGIKYSDEGQVFLDLNCSGNNLEIVVSDTGVGIPENKRKDIFEQFVQLPQAKPTTKLRDKGLGLGLSIVKELVSVMGGTIELRSKLGSGSTFIISLPLYEDSIKKQEADGKIYSGNKKIVDSENLKVLIAEDDQINRLYLKTIIERENWTVYEAADGREATQIAEQKLVDIILMDISMPVMDGIEAAQIIRKREDETPIIAVTAHAYDEDRKKILAAGINDIVLKPIDEDKLLRVIKGIIEIYSS